MQILLISFFTFLAFYGLLHIIMEIVSAAAQRKRDSDLCRNGGICRFYTVITVKNRETDVEGIIRAAAWRQLRLANAGNVPEIYAVDLDSEDKTYEILQRLELEYDFLRALQKEEYINSLVGDAVLSVPQAEQKI